MKFELEQEVWIVTETVTKVSVHCGYCDGKGKLVATSSKGPVDCICPECKGVKKFNTKTKWSPKKTKIESRFEFFSYVTGEKHECYLITSQRNIFTDNKFECENYFSSLEDLFNDPGYEDVNFNPKSLRSLYDLFATEEEAIAKCKLLKKK